MKTSLRDLMARSGVKFGTSGARGLAEAMTDLVCHTYTRGFLQYLRTTGQLPEGQIQVAVAGDLRPSTGRIMDATFQAIADSGGTPINCGRVPSPAVALFGFEQGMPSITVTGSHIPGDRNGIKFNKPAGEILKADEAGMTAQEVEIDERAFTPEGYFATGLAVSPAIDPRAGSVYVRRYLDAFPDEPMEGLRLGVYQHSAVGRDLMAEILAGLGAEVIPLGRSDTFVPVDTEAIRPEDIELARVWAIEDRFDALVSADGDSDRPLISDDRGEWLRGDVAGVLCARFLKADSVSTPVSSNTVLEKTGWFPEVRRTRIGSPFVIDSMLAATTSGRQRVVGYEANGGFLINSNLSLDGRALRALPTRDAMIVMVGVLLLARQQRKTVAQLVESLPPRFTASGRLENFAVEKSQEVLARFQKGTEALDRVELDAVFARRVGASVVTVDRLDGVRATFANDEVVHLRPSGNAPEFRCYVEAASRRRAAELCDGVLEWIRECRDQA